MKASAVAYAFLLSMMSSYSFSDTATHSQELQQDQQYAQDISMVIIQKLLTYNERLLEKNPNVATYARIIDQISQTIQETDQEFWVLFELAHILNLKPLSHAFAHAYLKNVTPETKDYFLQFPEGLSIEAQKTIKKHYFITTQDASVMKQRDEEGNETTITLSLDEIYYVKTILINNGTYELSNLFLSSFGNFNFTGMLIERINISNNCFTQVPPQLAQLKNLTSIDLSCNAITTLPQFLFTLPNLCYLNVRDNDIALLPKIPENDTALWRLDLDNNKLVSLPDSIKNCKNLAWISAQNNRLQTLPESICSLKKLEKLYLANNRFAMIPETILQHPGLRLLTLQGNPLKQKIETKTCKIIE